MQEITTRQRIQQIVASFYDRALTDPTIGHFFTEVVALDLEHHLPVIVDFWEGILLGNPVYRGNPMLKHLELARKSPLLPAHMERWLELWETTITKDYAGPTVDLAVRRAGDIGRLMLHKIG